MKKVVFIPADKNNIQYAQTCINSLRKFHTEEELPVVIIDEEKVKQLGDPNFWYRATPIIGKALLKDYDLVIKLDADTLVVGDLSHVWKNEDWDIAVVKNSNPREDKKYPVRLLDIYPLSYANCGFVVMKSKPFVEQWLKLCMSNHFQNFQYREQDLLNILIFYFSEPFGGPYKVRFLDDSNKWHGLVWKGYEPQVKLKDNKLVLEKNAIWPKDEDKELVAWHVAGGNQPNKMNYRLHFKDDVCKRLDELVKL